MVVAAAIALTAVAAPAATAAPATKPCPGERGVRCGSVLVPLYRGAPDGGGRKLRVRFRVYTRTRRAQPALEPLVAAEGGPGYSTFESADSYRFMLGPLHRRRDLIVMDNRGTGSSGAIDCPRLQAGKGVYSREVARCARKLGRAANAYGTGAAADDLAAVLDKLGVPRVNIYGDSYGTYFAQAFAVRHPERVRSVILDAAFGVEGLDPWIRQETLGIRERVDRAVPRSPGCGPGALATLGRWARRLERRPLVGGGTRRRRRSPPRARGRLSARPDGGRRVLLLHDLPRPAGGAARVRPGRPRAAASRGRGGPPVHRRRGDHELLRGRLRRGGVPRLPDAVGRLGPRSRAAAAVPGRARGARPEHLRALPERRLAALALHRPVRDRLHRVARAAVPRPAGAPRARSTRTCRCSCSTATWT